MPCRAQKAYLTEGSLLTRFRIKGERDGHRCQHPRLPKLSAAGVSIWLDDTSRDRLSTGILADLQQRAFDLLSVSHRHGIA